MKKPFQDVFSGCKVQIAILPGRYNGEMLLRKMGMEMRKKTRIFLLGLSVALIFLMLSSCEGLNPFSNVKYHTGGPYYYESFDSYGIPYLPYGEISEEDAKSRGTYVVAYFNKEGYIISFIKVFRNETDFSIKYYYDPHGDVEKREVTDKSGKTTVKYPAK